MKRIAISAILALAVIGIAGCTNWERASFQTLAASQATINQAQADYESGAIKQTTAAYTAINSAKASQVLAVNAMAAYEEAKAAGGTTASLAALQTDATVALANLPTLIANVKALYTGVK
jgi:hypothetical protein